MSEKPASNKQERIAVVGCGQVERVIEIPLDEAERAGLRASAEILRRTLESLRK
ncbi:MAG: hypothetical protein H0T60_13855 [Acidobacteria bacterium]|nr:hypothetical protein [Acidobacteriota bacterium]